MAEYLGLEPLGFLFALLAATAGTVVQGSIGFGFGMVLVPVLALVAPTSLPVTVLFLALPITLMMAVREWSALDRQGFWWILGGRAGGTAAGVWFLLILPSSRLSVVFGLVLLGSVLLSVIGPTIAIRPSTQVTTGVVSGLFATTAAIGGPPIALLYQNHTGPEIRSTLACIFAAGTVMSIGGLALTGQVASNQIALAAALGIFMLLGLWISRYTTQLVDGRWLRPAVLLFAALSGVIAVVRGLVA